jgi:hypothetical protein
MKHQRRAFTLYYLRFFIHPSSTPSPGSLFPAVRVVNIPLFPTSGGPDSGGKPAVKSSLTLQLLFVIWWWLQISSIHPSPPPDGIPSRKVGGLGGILIHIHLTRISHAGAHLSIVLIPGYSKRTMWAHIHPKIGQARTTFLTTGRVPPFLACLLFFWPFLFPLFILYPSCWQPRISNVQCQRITLLIIWCGHWPAIYASLFIRHAPLLPPSLAKLANPPPSP